MCWDVCAVSRKHLRKTRIPYWSRVVDSISHITRYLKLEKKFISILNYRRILFTIILKKNAIIKDSEVQRQSVAIIRFILLPLILNLLLLLVQISNLHRWEEQDTETGEAGGRSCTSQVGNWGKAKRDWLIVHIDIISQLWSVWLPVNWETLVVFSWAHHGLEAKAWH